MSLIQGIHHYCIALSYLCAFLFELARLVWPAKGWRVAGLTFGAAGLFAHSAYLAVHQPSLAEPSGSLLVLAWVLAFIYLSRTIRRAKQALAVFVLPVVIGLVVASRVLLTAAPESVSAVGWAAGDRFWGIVHGVLILLAAVGVSMSFLASVMYLIQARRLRRKVAPGTGVPMLSLERLEAMNRSALNLAFPLLTAGLLVGTLLLPNAPTAGDSWLSVKILSTAGLWLVFLVLLYLRYGAHVPSRRLATLSIASFALMLVALAASHPLVVGGAK